MLSALRRLAGTWFAKVLFVLLILSFAIWGIGDMVRNFGRDTSVARVAGQPIEVEEAQAAMRRELQRLTRMIGPQFEADERVRQAVANQAVSQLVMDRVLRQEAARMGLAVPDEAVREAIFRLEGFRGIDGRFSRGAFDSFLRNNGLSEPEFLGLIRADLARQQVTNAVRAGSAAPQALVRPMARWLMEERAATLVTLRNAEAPEPEAPSEATLRRYHENNAPAFSTPELRQAAIAVMTADRLMREVQVSEAEIAAAFEQRRDRFETQERREIEQALVQDQEKAAAIAALWRGGADLAAVAAAAEAAGGQAVDLGMSDRAGLPVPELADAAFALPEGGVSDPVRTGFGWHVLRAAKVEAGHAKTLDEAREELRTQLAAEKAADIAFERANRVEDALAGGATLAEAAQRFNLGFAEVTVDAEGRDAAGARVELPVIEASRAPLLQAIFQAERGAAPRLRETEAGFVAVDLRAVTPPALKPFESVEAEVRRAWTADARRRAQEERAAALLAAARGGKALAEAAREAGIGSRELGAIQRDPSRAGAVPQELLAPLFELKAQEATMVATRDGFAVAQVTEIKPADPDSDIAVLLRVQAEVEQAVAQELEVQFLEALRKRADVRINQRLLEQIARP